MTRPQPMLTSRSLNDLRDLHRRLDRRELQLSASTLSSDSSIGEGGADRGATVRLLWLSMMRVKWSKDTKKMTVLMVVCSYCFCCSLQMPKQLWRLCLCHLLTWFSIIAEALFYSDFMGQVIYNGDPTVHSHTPFIEASCCM